MLAIPREQRTIRLKKRPIGGWRSPPIKGAPPQVPLFQTVDAIVMRLEALRGNGSEGLGMRKVIEQYVSARATLGRNRCLSKRAEMSPNRGWGIQSDKVIPLRRKTTPVQKEACLLKRTGSATSSRNQQKAGAADRVTSRPIQRNGLCKK